MNPEWIVIVALYMLGAIPSACIIVECWDEDEPVDIPMFTLAVLIWPLIAIGALVQAVIEEIEERFGK